ncbi:lipid A biosynthesis acyltransferase [Leptotrichia wadei]|uniref:Lipid A biosynthesis acyltransferase n=1 Tax=Leptotrichia wadei TaxID=157687 RepID=A0A7U6LC53_9FUSO|nr:lipid A biosynthesis acyltransferase [Leptotrichia wadei]
MKTTIDFIIFSIFYIFIKIFNFFPPKIRLKISEFIGVLLFYLIPKGRKLSYRNLNLILNEQNSFNYSKKKIKEIAIKSYKNTAKSFLLPFWIYEYFENFPPKTYNSKLLEKLKSENERIILVTSHFGFFHASLFPTGNDRMFIPIRIIPNKFIESYMDKIRFRNNMTYFPEQNYKSFLKNKNSKGIFVLLSDVRKPGGDKITFF